jgi:hypothetical protein
MSVGAGAKLRRGELSDFDTDGIGDKAPLGLNFITRGFPETSLHIVTTEVFYIGLGDQYDDDRRRIRQAE